MNIGLFLGHPAHFHMLKNTAKALNADGHHVFFVIKQKDILEKLLQDAGYEYTLIREGRGNSIWGLVKSVLGMEWNMCKFLKINHIDILVGSTLSFAAHVIQHVPVIALGEDDANIVPKYAKMVYPWANAILSPVSCNNGKWESKSNKYPGYQKLAYLHPHHFTPDASIVDKYGIDRSKPYVLMRFAKLNAHHDVNVHGFSADIVNHVIAMLREFNPDTQFYITSERPLEPEFEQYRLHINPLDIHHVMAFATIYMGDSQSMAVEAAMLGIPSLRFNDFVGAKKIGVMEELEHTYGLTYGISSHCPEQLYARLQEWLAMGDKLRDEFQTRRQRMLADKIDVTAFFTWFVENFPQSAQDAKRPDFNWSQFR